MTLTRKITSMTTLLIVAIVLNGCVGFSGPNKIRNSIAKSQNVELKKEFGVDVGPLGFFAVNTLAGPFTPMTLDGMDWAAVGEYTIVPTAQCSLEDFCLDKVELKGWEPFVRIREPGSCVKLMYNAKGDRIKKLLVLTQEGDQLMIVRAEGNFEKIIDNFFKSELSKDFDFFKERDEGSEHDPYREHEDAIEVAHNSTR